MLEIRGCCRRSKPFAYALLISAVLGIAGCAADRAAGGRRPAQLHSPARGGVRDGIALLQSVHCAKHETGPCGSLSFLSLSGSVRHVYGPIHTVGGLSSPNGTWLLFSGRDHRSHLVNLLTGRQLRVFPATDHEFAFSYDSRYIAYLHDSYTAIKTTIQSYDTETRTAAVVGRGIKVGFPGEAGENSPDGFAWAHRSDRLAFTLAPPIMGPWRGVDRIGVAAPHHWGSVRRVRLGVGLKLSPPAWGMSDRGFVYWRIGRGGRVLLVAKGLLGGAETLAVGPPGECQGECAASALPPIAAAHGRVLAGPDIFQARGLVVVLAHGRAAALNPPGASRYDFSGQPQPQPNGGGDRILALWSKPGGQRLRIAVFSGAHASLTSVRNVLSANWIYGSQSP